MSLILLCHITVGCNDNENLVTCMRQVEVWFTPAGLSLLSSEQVYICI